MSETDIYKKLGASATKDEVHAAIKNQSEGVFPGTFCKLIADIAGDKDMCFAMHADGAGTKSTLAYIKYKETGSLDPLRDIATDSMVMNMDDLLCIGATGGFVMSNTIGRNAHLVPGEAIAAVIEGYERFIENMKKFDIDITMSGGETADVGDLVGTLIVDSTFCVRLPRKNVVDCANIRPHDVIVSLDSFGQCSYEAKYNAGMGSNGLTASRHLLLSHKYADKYPETVANGLDSASAYTGAYSINDILPGTDITVGDAILSPTRTYAPLIRDVLDSKRDRIHGIIHCTGGAQTKCLNFGNSLHYVKNALPDIPPLFREIERLSGMSRAEMYRVFNMGARMELFTDEATADFIISAAKKYNIGARVSGYTEASEGKNTLTITDKDGKYEYSK